MSNERLGEEPNDLTDVALWKVTKHLLRGRILEVKSQNEVIRLEKGSSRNSNTKPGGFVFIVALISPPTPS